VLSATPGGPAFRAGIRAGDVITAINGLDTVDLGVDGPVKLIRGEPGTPVNVSIQSPGQEPREITIVRALIRVDSVMGYSRDETSKWIFHLPDHPRIGYVWLESFGEETSRELARALEQIEPDIDALIVDVRTNAGGILTAAVEVCDMFIPEGTIVTIRSRYASREEEGTAGNERFPANKPLVVLADRYSASAAEIFAACMQDYGRAIVIGQRTWGKGTVQSVFEMEGGRSALRLTTATYWRPSGTNIHRRPDAKDEDSWGVLPNEGFEIEYEDEEYVRFLRERNRRFAGGSSEMPSDDATQSEADQEIEIDSASDEPFVDRQLERAVEYIQQQLSVTTLSGS
jgi:carboxyl-terminal processing protease